jgi:metallo-beta-lactamase family protein
MKIYFHGATGDVTGSAYHVETKHGSMLVDCGLYQGGKESRAKNRQRAKLEGGKLDAVVLSHAHLDHVGRLPLLTVITSHILRHLDQSDGEIMKGAIRRGTFFC